MVAGSLGIAIRRLTDWIARFSSRLAIELASPSWSRASR
jgi:hypothetical protein